MLCNVPLGACPSDLSIHHGVVMSGSALTPSHENGSPWLATLPRTARMNAKAAKVAKGAAAQRIATLALTRGGQLCDLRGLCVHRRGCDRSLTRPWRGQS